MRLILSFFLIMAVSGTLISVYPSAYNARETVTYTWTIGISGINWSLPLFPLELNFPSGTYLSFNSIMTINGAVQAFTYSYNPSLTITITSSIPSTPFTAIVTNIVNPSSGSYFYSYKNPRDGVSNSVICSFSDSPAVRYSNGGVELE
jgi:hypothetical protein